MKSNILFALIFCIVVASASDIDPNYNYDTFMKQFGRTYTGDEKDRHEKIFN